MVIFYRNDRGNAIGACIFLNFLKSKWPFLAPRIWYVLLQVRWPSSCKRLILLSTGASLLQVRFTLPRTRRNLLLRKFNLPQIRCNFLQGRFNLLQTRDNFLQTRVSLPQTRRSPLQTRCSLPTGRGSHFRFRPFRPFCIESVSGLARHILLAPFWLP